SQGAPVHGVCGQHAGAACVRRLPADSCALPRSACVLPGEARPAGRRAALDTVSRAAMRRHILRARRLLRAQRSAGTRVRADDDREVRRRGDSGIGVLRRAGRSARGALLFREEGRNPARGLATHRSGAVADASRNSMSPAKSDSIGQTMRAGVALALGLAVASALTSAVRAQGASPVEKAAAPAPSVAFGPGALKGTWVRPDGG